MDLKSEFVQAKGTPQTFLGLHTVRSRFVVAATVAIARFISAPVIIVHLDIVFRIIVIGRKDVGRFFLLFLRPTNQVVRKGNVENQIRADGQFDFPIDVALVIFFLFLSLSLRR